MSDQYRPDPSTEDEGNEPASPDQLMRAKDKAENEAQRWSEIEDLGQPVRSQDQPNPGVTQQVEPPRQHEDTPTGQETPAEPMPPVSQPARRGRPAEPPPFPHPTDPPRQSPQVPATEDAPIPVPRHPEPPPPLEPVRVDKEGMPLPKRVPREDPEATIVSDSAYQDMLREPPADDQATVPHGYRRVDLDETVRRERVDYPPPQAPPQQYYQPAPPPPPPVQAPPPPPRPSQRKARQPRPQPSRRRIRFSWGCLVRTLMLGIVAGLVALMLGGGAASIFYARQTAPTFRDIDDITDLQGRALQFETTRIRDRNGSILYEINDPQGGRRDYVTLNEVSPWVVVATVATEERNYFTNPGFSIYDITRAVVQNYREGRVVSGASTITQQLTRALLLTEEERTERTYRRKIKEIFLAAELGRRFTKQEVLELYLNQIYYGNLAYGIEAAAQTYFNKSARDLTMAEAAFLAGLPQAPAFWDPVTNREGALIRQQQVVTLMLEAGCLDTGNTGLDLSQYCVTSNTLLSPEYRADLDRINAMTFNPPAIQAKYPHWVVYVQQQLEANPTIGPAIYTSGFDVYTTLDPRLQDAAQSHVESALAGLTDRNVNNASVVVIDVHTGAILAMVGSRDFDDEAIDGQVNVALTPQQPGSSIKHFTYLTAFEKGWTPATIIWDVPFEYEIPGFGTYAPVNYDGRFRGPVSVRYAIANSLNVPAVTALDYVGVPALLELLNRFGITSLGTEANENNFGLSLTLGAGEVYLLEWTNAYATIASGGVFRPVYAIERVERNGQLVEGYPYQVPPGEQVIKPTYAYLLQSILSDKEARRDSFGPDSVISPPYPAGAKTGTTNDFRDNWTMGFTSEIAVGVWVGNTDNTPMVNVTGVTGAGPIWRGVMDVAVQWYPPQEFKRPDGVFNQTVCKDDGAEPSQYCVEHSSTITEIFAIDTPPPKAEESIYRTLRVDSFTGLIANEHCLDYTQEGFFLVFPNHSQLIDIRPVIRLWLTTTDRGTAWLTERGISPDVLQKLPPEEECGPDTPRPLLEITNPQPGSEQSGEVIVMGSVDAPNFSHYVIDFGLSEDPQGWGSVQGPTSQPIINGALGRFDVSELPNGPGPIRLVVFDKEGHSAEVRVTFLVNNPTPTPTPTPKPTGTPAPTATPTPGATTPTPTSTPTPSETPTP